MIRLITKTFIDQSERAREKAARINATKTNTLGVSATVEESSTFRQSSMVLIIL